MEQFTSLPPNKFLPPTPTESCDLQALNYLLDKNYKAAETRINQLIKSSPRCAYLLGMECMRRNDITGAKGVFKLGAQHGEPRAAFQRMILLSESPKPNYKEIRDLIVIVSRMKDVKDDDQLAMLKITETFLKNLDVPHASQVDATVRALIAIIGEEAILEARHPFTYAKLGEINSFTSESDEMPETSEKIVSMVTPQESKSLERTAKAVDCRDKAKFGIKSKSFEFAKSELNAMEAYQPGSILVLGDDYVDAKNTEAARFCFTVGMCVNNEFKKGAAYRMLLLSYKDPNPSYKEIINLIDIAFPTAGEVTGLKSAKLLKVGEYILSNCKPEAKNYAIETALALQQKINSSDFSDKFPKMYQLSYQIAIKTDSFFGHQLRAQKAIEAGDYLAAELEIRQMEMAKHGSAYALGITTYKDNIKAARLCFTVGMTTLDCQKESAFEMLLLSCSAASSDLSLLIQWVDIAFPKNEIRSDNVNAQMLGLGELLLKSIGRLRRGDRKTAAAQALLDRIPITSRLISSVSYPLMAKLEEKNSPTKKLIFNTNT